jgi:FtsZ-binding cell division protein ZapB
MPKLSDAEYERLLRKEKAAADAAHAKGSWYWMDGRPPERIREVVESCELRRREFERVHGKMPGMASAIWNLFLLLLLLAFVVGAFLLIPFGHGAIKVSATWFAIAFLISLCCYLFKRLSEFAEWNKSLSNENSRLQSENQDVKEQNEQLKRDNQQYTEDHRLIEWLDMKCMEMALSGEKDYTFSIDCTPEDDRVRKSIRAEAAKTPAFGSMGIEQME